jgi:membrane protease subunit (stomatin/prohibitin family)
MQTLQNAIAAIKYFQHRQNTKSQNRKKKAGDWMKKLSRSSKCVECGGHVPPYQKYLCEKCWQEALNAKIKAEDRDEAAIKNPDRTS